MVILPTLGIGASDAPAGSVSAPTNARPMEAGMEKLAWFKMLKISARN